MLEGLVRIISRKRVVVQSLSLSEVLHSIEARLLNEVYCIELANERTTSQQILPCRRFWPHRSRC